MTSKATCLQAAERKGQSLPVTELSFSNSQATANNPRIFGL